MLSITCVIIYPLFGFVKKKTYCGIIRSPSANVRVGFTAKYSYEFKLKAENEYINAEKKHDYAAKNTI